MDEVGTVPDKTGGSIHEANGCLIVPVEGTLDEDGLERLGAEILRRLEKTPVRGVMINVSGVALLSSHGFSVLKHAARAVGMMGRPAVFVGFQAGVVSALVDLDVDTGGILAVGTMEEAFALLEIRAVRH